jgi:hypothetical protein
MAKTRGFRVLIICVALLAIVAVVGLYLYPAHEIFRVYSSPMGKYHLIVYRYKSRLPAMPGDASGGEGYVRLYDTYGKLYGEAGLSIVAVASSAADVKWDDGEVSLPGAFDFKVPKEAGAGNKP